MISASRSHVATAAGARARRRRSQPRLGGFAPLERVGRRVRELLHGVALSVDRPAADIVASRRRSSVRPRASRQPAGGRAHRPCWLIQRRRVRAADPAVDQELGRVHVATTRRDARNRAALAISVGLARTGPSARGRAAAARRSGSDAYSSRSSGVSTGPGHSALTRTPLLGELDAQLAGHRQHAALRRGVGDLRGGRAHHRDERGGVDHRAAAARQQVRDPVLAAEEHAAQVGRLDALLRLQRRLEHRGVVGRRDAGVVEQHVDPAEPLATGAYIDTTAARR